MIIRTRNKIILARILQKIVMLTRINRDPLVEVKRNNICYRLDLREGIDFAVYLGAYENSTVNTYKQIIKQGDTVIDIGANIGAHTLQFASLVGNSGRVIAFEPTDFALAKLKTNALLNPDLASRIVLNQIMLVDCQENCQTPTPDLYSSWPLKPGNDTHPDHLGKKMKTSHATPTTLDAYVKGNNVSKVNFIKLDVDGYEYHVLKGAAFTIKENRPVIIMELCPYLLNETGHGLGEVLELLYNLDYQLKDMVSKKLLSHKPDCLKALIPRGASKNIIACSQPL